MKTPSVSIIVCTFNRSAALQLAVESLLRLKVDGYSYEIVIVDNGSTDDTKAVVQNLQQQSAIEVVYVYEPQPGVVSARNRGVAESRGGWLAFFDDDQLADPDWLQLLLSEAEQRGVPSVGGSVLLQLPPDCLEQPVGVTRRMLGEAIICEHPVAYGRKHAPGAGNWLLRREIFERVGLFNPALANGGEDTDLFRRIRAAGIASWYVPGAVVHHLIPQGRLEPDHLKRTALRIGSHVAQREYEDYGRLVFLLLIAARYAQGLLFRSRLLLNQARGQAQAALANQCLVWRVRGYCRWGLRLLWPRFFGQDRYFGRLAFRDDRVTAGKEFQSVQI